jgi:hypothetical protein
MNRLRKCTLMILIAGFLAHLLVPACVAGGNPPLVTSINGPGVEEFVNNPGPFQFSVQVTGGTPPYTYVWKKTLLHTSTLNDVLQCSQDNTITVTKDDMVYSGLTGGGSYAIYVEVTDSRDIMATWDWDDYTHVYFGRFYSRLLPPNEGLCNTDHWSNPDQESWMKIVDGDCWAEGTQPRFPYTPSSQTVTSHPACSPPQDSFPWQVIVGGLAAVAAAAAIAAKILKSKPKKKGEPPRESYILQLSKDQVTVSMKQGDSFTVTAWKVTGEGGLLPASSAFIQVTPPPNIPGIALTPASGQGSLTATVSLSTFSGSGSGIITVTASAGGGSISADVKVTIEAEADIEFD